MIGLSWWQHEKDTRSASLALLEGGSKGPGIASFDVNIDVRPNKL